ncbi:hypothetical protein GCM10009616_35620 [Microlunatus lacustris]
MNAEQMTALYAFAGIVASIIGSIIVTKLSARAEDRKTKTQGELGSGALAIRIANRADRKASAIERRLDAGDRWRREVTDEWWPHHQREFDRLVTDELKRLDPNAEIPQQRPMPTYVPPALPAEEDDEDEPPA